jgi:uncharacterized cupredoxin-like copper-binding protein
MSTIAPDPPTAEEEQSSTELRELRNEVRRQGDSIRATGRAFSIFAVLAFLVALATLIAVVAKLDNTSTTSAATARPSAAATPTAAPAPGHAVSVGLGEFVVRPSAAVAAAGPVRFAVHNAGSVTHEFVVLRTDKPAGSLLNGARADESGNVGETGDLAAGASKTITVKLAAGHYALICNLPGHYQAGQHTDFTVR